jgi:hypothetical protein
MSTMKIRTYVSRSGSIFFGVLTMGVIKVTGKRLRYERINRIQSPNVPKACVRRILRGKKGLQYYRELMVAGEISNVVLSKRTLETIVNAAKEGYLKPYKQERLGILLGRLKKDTLFVSNAFLHRGGKYTRTSAMVLESHKE